MKHLPNLLTLGNLFSGCLAIVYILNSQPYLAGFNGEAYWVTGTEQAYYGSICILVAAFFDLLDGFAARKLNISSAIGRELDSLADVVSFGVAPAMILFKMLWAAHMSNPNAMDVSMLAMSPAFLVACFSALRLARYNVTSTEQTNSFIGMPTPAAGLFIASLPLINWYNPMGIGVYLQNAWVLYLIIGILCWFMVSRIRFIKLVPGKLQMSAMWPQLVLLIAGVAGAVFFRLAVIPLVFILYILLSFVYKPKENTN